MTTEVEGRVFSAGPLERAELAALLAGRFDAMAVAVVRSAAGAEFVPFEPESPDTFLGRWTDGQIFDRVAELRWRRERDVYHTLLLTEQATPPAAAADGKPFEQLTEEPYTVVNLPPGKTDGFLLWGTTLVDDYWLETRVPRPLRYPLKTRNKPPRLSYLLYQQNAAVHWVRLTGLKEEVT